MYREIFMKKIPYDHEESLMLWMVAASDKKPDSFQLGRFLAPFPHGS